MAPCEDGGGERLFSHSFMKSEAVFFRLLGVRRFRTGGRSSSSFVLFESALETEAEGVLGDWRPSREAEGFFFLRVGG